MLNNNNLKKINLEGDTPYSSKLTINTNQPEKLTPLASKFIPFIIAILLGIGTGFIGHNLFPWKASVSSAGKQIVGDAAGLKVGDVVGLEDGLTTDKAVGILQSGGFEGEGSHKLIRPGGVARTVYLTSSVVDLDQFVGHKVTVWGETFSAQKAGWLMDVVRVKLEKLNAQLEEE